jgi:hypothetical protein
VRAAWLAAGEDAVAIGWKLDVLAWLEIRDRLIRHPVFVLETGYSRVEPRADLLFEGCDVMTLLVVTAQRERDRRLRHRGVDDPTRALHLAVGPG